MKDLYPYIGYDYTMPRKKNVNKSAEILQAEQHLRELRATERNKEKVEQANLYLHQYENEYDRAKTIFFGVNGARRIMKKANRA